MVHTRGTLAWRNLLYCRASRFVILEELEIRGAHAPSRVVSAALGSDWRSLKIDVATEIALNITIPHLRLGASNHTRGRVRSTNLEARQYNGRRILKRQDALCALAPLRESFSRIFSRKAAKAQRKIKTSIFLGLKPYLLWRLGGEKIIRPGFYLKRSLM